MVHFPLLKFQLNKKIKECDVGTERDNKQGERLPSCTTQQPPGVLAHATPKEAVTVVQAPLTNRTFLTTSRSLCYSVSIAKRERQRQKGKGQGEGKQTGIREPKRKEKKQDSAERIQDGSKGMKLVF